MASLLITTIGRTLQTETSSLGRLKASSLMTPTAMECSTRTISTATTTALRTMSKLSQQRTTLRPADQSLTVPLLTPTTMAWTIFTTTSKPASPEPMHPARTLTLALD